MPRPTILCVELLLEWPRSLLPPCGRFLGQWWKKFEASQPTRLSDRKRRGNPSQSSLVCCLGMFFSFYRFSNKNSSAFLCPQTLLLHHHTSSYKLSDFTYFIEIVFLGIPRRLLATVEIWRWRLHASANEIECCRFCQLRIMRPNQCGYAATPII